MTTFIHDLVGRCSTLVAVTALAACGDGDGDGAADAPTIAQFSADRGSCFVGERARLADSCSGGSGRIEPGIGTVAGGEDSDGNPVGDVLIYG